MLDGQWHLLFGDPAPGVRKKMTIWLSDGTEHVMLDSEGVELTLPLHVTVQRAVYHNIDVTDALRKLVDERARATQVGLTFFNRCVFDMRCCLC